MTEYIYQKPEWPHFHWDFSTLTEQLATVRHQQGLLLGRMGALGFDLRQEACLETLVEDVLKTSEIEGEKLDMEQVRSSVARHLGLDVAGLEPVDRHVEGVVEMLLDATQNFNAAITEERLFAWHAALFPTGRSGLAKIKVDSWRDDSKGPMQVVSGPMGRDKVHFEAPAAAQLPNEMRRLITWINEDSPTDPILKASMVHIWFITLHPFDDGNGRIARALTDYILARSEKSALRFYSMSAQIRQERKRYYDLLEATQKNGLDITPWVHWFIQCLSRAIIKAENKLSAVLFKADFWNQAKKAHLNSRQHLVLNRLLNSFEGKLTSSKWAKLAKCSHDTALRDIEDLLRQGILIKNPAGGRSTNYEITNS